MTGLEKRRTKGIQECISSLETLFKYYKNDSEFNYQLEVSNSPFNLIKKYLKALEIIKKKNVNPYLIKKISFIEYGAGVQGFGWELLTEKEFNLLKEVLVDE